MQKTDIPELNSIYLNLTNRCNLKCSHCWLSSGMSLDKEEGWEEVDLGVIKRSIKRALPLGLNNVKITGGEPFLRKDINDLIEFLHSLSLSISIETNGTLIDEHTAALLKNCEVSLVSISLDGVNPESHDTLRGKRGSFDKTVSAIESLIEKGINVQIITTLHSGNADELLPVLYLADKLKVDSVSVNPIIPSGRAMDMFSTGQALEIHELIRLDREIESAVKEELSCSVYFTLPLAFKSMDFIKNRNFCECNIMNILGILGNGGISICGIGYKEENLIFGNVLDDDIQNIWNNNEELKRFRSAIPSKLKGVCSRCLFKDICCGYCRANTYTVEKDILAPYWLCQSAYEEGVFPPSRLI